MASLKQASMAILRSLPDLTMKTNFSRPTYAETGSTLKSVDDQESMSPVKETNHRPFHLLMAGFEALDLVNVGLLVTSATGQLLLANRTAEGILKARDGLELTGGGAVRTSMKSTPSLNMLFE